MPQHQNRGSAMKKKACPELDAFIPDLSSTDRWGAIGELVDALAAAGLVTDKARAVRDVEERERSLPTGLTDGVALPHASTPAVERRCSAAGISRAGLDFGCLDCGRAHLIFLALANPAASGPHLECLAEISLLLSDERKRRAFMEAQSLDEARSLLG